MAIRVALSHQTRYKYDKPVQLTPQVVRLRPAPHCRTPILAYSLKIEPKNHFIHWQQDAYANYLARLTFLEPTRCFQVAVDLVAEMTVINPFDFFIEKEAEYYPFKYPQAVAKELIPFLETLPAGPLLEKFLVQARKEYVLKGRRIVDVMVDLNRHVQKSLRYDIRMEPGVQTPEETFQKGHGSCRDFTWLLVQAARQLGFAARFVSGYSIQLAPDVKPLEGPSGVTKDVCDLHAWAELYLPGAGWVGLDATSGLMCGEGHIPLAATAEPSNAAPITGDFAWLDGKEGKDEFSYKMSVTRIYEDPRVTRPYSDEQWKRIELLGHQIDEDIKLNDIRLTMGGEPTFVSIDDMDGAEWNTLAMGPHKRRLAEILIKRLRGRFAPGGLLHYGQGKWYPGESLPRFALSCWWRKDGLPIWENPELIADVQKNYSHDSELAGKFIRQLSDELQVDGKFALPAYEDVWYYLWKERRLPLNVDPLKNNLKDEEERVRMAKIFEQGLEKIVGFALPLRPLYGDSNRRWETGAWFFRPEHMYLIPGDSAMGFRLPLDSLGWVPPGDYPFVYEQDLSVQRPELPDYRQMRLTGMPLPANPRGYREQIAAAGRGQPPRAGVQDDPSRRPEPGQSAPWIIRTALCVEARQGRLHVFMPPQRYLEDYLDLVAQIENTAARLKTPVVIEGYLPPRDPRVNQISVTPDPGVIEVNVQPANNWNELVEITSGLYEEARQTRLGTEKFQLDGRHTGTGGGNHIVVGAAYPDESPFLRRPDLLKSLVGYWNNHPSLSYLFSGLFVGPTSQAPRTDEGRSDLLYEIQTAFRQVPPRDAPSLPSWITDRLFRNLLVDLTGNTHRSEFCIDKLYSPDSASGRLGLVEFRGFEMPPHPRMSLTQQLLLRSLIARFWKQPYETNLVKWSTELHDRFMLPHFNWQDFSDVLDEMQRSGFPLQSEWFAPHFEFRFPHVGVFGTRDVNVELRQAIEPWYVLGEEPAGGATVRYVDSSLERMQVKVAGMVDSRHVITCNGQTLPLHPTGTRGQFVAGVRFKAWAPAAALHPTIGVHTPLVFDVVDTWNQRSVGGCTYYVSHPAGRNYSVFPVNAYEAESRRASRFFRNGHTQGRIEVKAPQILPEFPFTLDLRRT
jgi:uncharacterized protein (DUF2126 family)/transglutaminase-like putative cysteine protease